MTYFTKDVETFTKEDLTQLKKDLLSLKKIQHIEILCLIKDKNDDPCSYNTKKEQLIFNWMELPTKTKTQIVTIIKMNKK